MITRAESCTTSRESYTITRAESYTFTRAETYTITRTECYTLLLELNLIPLLELLLEIYHIPSPLLLLFPRQKNEIKIEMGCSSIKYKKITRGWHNRSITRNWEFLSETNNNAD